MLKPANPCFIAPSLAGIKCQSEQRSPANYLSKEDVVKTKITGQSKTMVALLFMAVMVSGCTVAKISGRGSMPMMLNTPPQRVEVIEHFTESKMVTFDYTGAFDVSDVLADKMQQSDGDAITNLVIEIKSDFGTFMVNLITLGLANAKLFSVEGDLVKIEGGISGLLGSYEVVTTFDSLDNSTWKAPLLSIPVWCVSTKASP